MDTYQQALLAFLSPMVNDNRSELIEQVLKSRTRYISVILEDIYLPQNASAVLRTCDCFGIQDVHIIENRNRYELNPEVERGAAQWLTLKKYNQSRNNTGAAIDEIKKAGYRIVATTPHHGSSELAEFDISGGKTAIMFGTERRGLSEIALEKADEFIKIPMVGFTESLNLSVAAAIILHQLSLRLSNSDLDWHLKESEYEQIRLQWYKNSIKRIAKIEQGFKKTWQQ